MNSTIIDNGDEEFCVDSEYINNHIQNHGSEFVCTEVGLSIGNFISLAFHSKHSRFTISFRDGYSELTKSGSIHACSNMLEDSQVGRFRKELIGLQFDSLTETLDYWNFNFGKVFSISSLKSSGSNQPLIYFESPNGQIFEFNKGGSIIQTSLKLTNISQK